MNEQDEARLAAIVCRSESLEEQRGALQMINSPTPLRLLLAHFAVYAKVGNDNYEWSEDLYNAEEVLKLLLQRVNWQGEFGRAAPDSTCEIYEHILASKGFQRRVMFLGGFRAPMDNDYPVGECNDWRYGAIVAIKLVLSFTGRRQAYDRRLKRAVQRNPEGPDAFLLADSIRSNKQGLRLCQFLGANQVNPELAQYIDDISDH